MNAGWLVPWGRQEDRMQEKLWRNRHRSLPWLHFLILAHALQPGSCRARLLPESCLECTDLFTLIHVPKPLPCLSYQKCVWNLELLQVVVCVAVKPEGKRQGTTFERMTEPEDTT